MKKALFIVVLFSFFVLGGCVKNNQQIQSGDEILKNEKTGNQESQLKNEVSTNEENLITTEDESQKLQQGKVPDCYGKEGVPFEWYSAAELKQIGKSAKEILEYGKLSNDAIYCRKKDGLSDDKIKYQLKEYGLSETESQIMLLHSR